MNYKYPPLTKYLVYFVLIYLFLKHQKIMRDDRLIMNVTLITSIAITLDYILIADHPSPTETGKIELDGEKLEEILSEDDEFDTDTEDPEEEPVKKKKQKHNIKEENIEEYTNAQEYYDPYGGDGLLAYNS